MKKNLDEVRYIKLDLFRPKTIKYLSKKSFKLEFEIDNIELLDVLPNIIEDDSKSLIRKYGMNKYYKNLKDMPFHMQYAIGNSRDSNTLDEIMKLIYDDFKNYAFIFSEREVYDYLSSFFNNVLDVIIREGLKFDINDIRSFKKVIFYLNQNEEVKNELTNILLKYGIPFLNYNCRKNNKVIICIDNFIVLGILISLLKRLLYVDYNCDYILNLFINDISKSNLALKLDELIYNCYIENIINTFNSSSIDKFNMYYQVKNVKIYINLFDFYYHWFNYNYEYTTNDFKDSLKNEECELIRKFYINKVEKNKTKGQYKKLESVNKMNNTQLLRKYRKDINEGRI